MEDHGVVAQLVELVVAFVGAHLRGEIHRGDLLVSHIRGVVLFHPHFDGGLSLFDLELLQIRQFDLFGDLFDGHDGTRFVWRHVQISLSLVDLTL